MDPHSIKAIVSSPSFDRAEALREHRGLNPQANAARA